MSPSQRGRLARLRDLNSAALGPVLLRGAAGSLTLIVANAGLSIAASVVLARVLGVTEYGIFSYVIAVSLLVSVFAVLGADRLVIRAVAVYESRNEWHLLRGLIRGATWSIFTVSCFLAIGLSVFAITLADAAVVPAFILGMAALPTTALVRVNQSILVGLRHVVIAQMPEFLIRPLLFLGLTIGLAIAVTTPTARDVVSLYSASTFVAFGLSVVLLRRFLPDSVRSAAPSYSDAPTWGRSAFELALLSGAGILNEQIGIVLLGAILGPEEAGIYAVAVRGAVLISFGLAAVNTVLAPTAARLWSSGDLSGLQKAVTVTARAAFFFALPIAVLFIAFGEPMLSFAFGTGFGQAAGALAILSVGQLVNAAMGSVGTLLIMTGHQRDAAVGSAAGAVVNIGLGMALIPVLGVAGAAIAAAGSVVVWNVLFSVAAYLRLGVDPTVVGRLARLRGPE